MNLIKIFNGATMAHTLKPVEGGFQLVCTLANEVQPVLGPMALDQACNALVEHEIMARHFHECPHLMIYQVAGMKCHRHHSTFAEAETAFHTMLDLYLHGVLDLDHLLIIERSEGDNSDDLYSLADQLSVMGELFQNTLEANRTKSEAIMALSDRSIAATHQIFNEILAYGKAQEEKRELEQEQGLIVTSNTSI